MLPAGRPRRPGPACGATNTSGTSGGGHPPDRRVAGLARGRHHVDVSSGCLPKIAPPSLILGLLVAALIWPAGVSANEFPSGHTAYHTYTEVGTEVAAVAAAHPDIVKRFSIGQSYKGRELWAAKISDNVGDGRERARGAVRRRHPCR